MSMPETNANMPELSSDNDGHSSIAYEDLMEVEEPFAGVTREDVLAETSKPNTFAGQVRIEETNHHHHNNQQARQGQV